MFARLLGLDWQLPGQVTGQAAPGSGLVCELWRRGADRQLIVRVRYVVQGLDQMRYLRPLDDAHALEIALVSVPWCSGPDAACTLPAFAARVLAAVAPSKTAAGAPWQTATSVERAMPDSA
jgi:4-phytase/acid phosphatase